MKKLIAQIIIIGISITTFVTPLLAGGSAGP